jgi:restriction system protein
MNIPNHNDIALPLLRYASDQQEHFIRDAAARLAEFFNLSEEQATTLMPKTNQSVFVYRTHWANTYLKKAGLLESAGRGKFRITQRGLDVLASNPPALTRTYLMKFEEFREFVAPAASPEEEHSKTDDLVIESEESPKELIQSLSKRIREELADELLEYVLDVSPAFFEKLVVDLLLAMGYGGSLPDAGEVLGRSHDGGIDGRIHEDKLGLSTIYIQAKRWDRGQSIGRKEIQAFVGSLMGQSATKGVFITTSYFTNQAQLYVSNLPNLKVILIDGLKLAQLMIEHNIGVAVEQTVVIKRVDSDYFDV